MIRSSIICSRMIRSKLNLISTLRGANISFVAIFVLLLSSIAFRQGGVATGDLRITVKRSQGRVGSQCHRHCQRPCEGIGAYGDWRRTGRIHRSPTATGELQRDGGSDRIR
jgi:hypothetical protein